MGGNQITEQNVDYAIALTVSEKSSDSLVEIDKDILARTALGKPVRMYCKYCYNEIYNPDSFLCGDLKEELSKLRADSLRFDFSAESAEDCEAILRGRPPLRYTRGRLRSGVE